MLDMHFLLHLHIFEKALELREHGCIKNEKCHNIGKSNYRKAKLICPHLTKRYGNGSIKNAFYKDGSCVKFMCNVEKHQIIALTTGTFQKLNKFDFKDTEVQQMFHLSLGQQWLVTTGWD